MNYTRKEFQEEMSENDYGVSNFVVVNGKYQWPQTEEAYQVWQACQSINDKRIQQLLAVIAKKDLYLGKIATELVSIDKAELAAIEAIAIKPENVELVEVGYISYDGQEVFLTMGMPIDADTCGVPVDNLYTIKTKD